jgi:hypothetical protein
MSQRIGNDPNSAWVTPECLLKTNSDCQIVGNKHNGPLRRNLGILGGKN